MKRKPLFGIGIILFAVMSEAKPTSWMLVKSTHELAFVVTTAEECDYPRPRLEEIVVRNIYRLELVPILYPIANADLFLRVNLNCFKYGKNEEFVFDLDVDFGLDNGEVRVLYVDGDYDAYGVMVAEGIDAMVDFNTGRAVKDFANANSHFE